MLRSKLNDEMKRALKEKDTISLATVRLILAAIKDRDIQARTEGKAEGLSDADIEDLLIKMVRQRRESIEMYKKGGREDLAEREHKEIEVIKKFLPQPISESEMEVAIEDVITEVGAESIKDMGRVVSRLKELYRGRLDTAKASQIIKERLS